MLRITEDSDCNELYRLFSLEGENGEIGSARFRADRIPTDAISHATHAPSLAAALKLLHEAGGEIFRMDLTDTE